jgi:hypothetical protein
MFPIDDDTVVQLFGVALFLACWIAAAIVYRKK